MGAILTETETTSNVLDAVIEYVPKVIDLAGDCFQAIVNNPVLLFYFAVGMVGVGLGVFAMLKNTARG